MSTERNWASRRRASTLKKFAGSGGEGSRGGHVTGHTAKGNPIYGAPADKKGPGAKAAPKAAAPAAAKVPEIGKTRTGGPIHGLNPAHVKELTEVRKKEGPLGQLSHGGPTSKKIDTIAEEHVKKAGDNLSRHELRDHAEAHAKMAGKLKNEASKMEDKANSAKKDPDDPIPEPSHKEHELRTAAHLHSEIAEHFRQAAINKYSEELNRGNKK